MESKESLLTKHILSYDENDFITRILRFEHLRALIEEKTLKIPRISAWDDTHENFLFKSTIKVDKHDFGNIFQSFNFHDRFFGLCWSYWNETDALWRIYSPQRESVKIKVRIGKLFQYFHDYYERQSKKTILPALGRIVYVNKSDWNTVFSHEFFMDFEGFIAHNIMFVKRMEFEYENEFRTIMVSLKPQKNATFVEIPVDPIELIEEVVFDPRAKTEIIEEYTAVLSQLGIKNIYKSSLYDDVNFEITHDPEKLKLPPLKVVNYFDRNNALRLCGDYEFEGLLTDMAQRIKDSMDNS